MILPASNCWMSNVGRGFNVPDGMMVVGLPLGNVRHENAVWTKFQLFDGREIGIAADSKRSGEIAKQFLLEEKSNRGCKAPRWGRVSSGSDRSTMTNSPNWRSKEGPLDSLPTAGSLSRNMKDGDNSFRSGPKFRLRVLGPERGDYSNRCAIARNQTASEEPPGGTTERTSDHPHWPDPQRAAGPPGPETSAISAQGANDCGSIVPSEQKTCVAVAEGRRGHRTFRSQSSLSFRAGTRRQFRRAKSFGASI